MADLVQILKDNDIGNGENSIDRMKEIVAESIAKYLQDNVAVTSMEVRRSLRELTEQRVIRNPDTSSGDYISHEFYQSFYTPGSNSHIRFSEKFKKRSIEEFLNEAKRMLQQSVQEQNPYLEIEIIFGAESDSSWVQRRISPRGVHVYYHDETKLPAFILGKLRETHRTYTL